ncbi:unnamed protein product [Gadus morhua 'NCC']
MGLGLNICPTSQKPQGSGIANLTFDLFKLHRKEFLGCLSIRATLYEILAGQLLLNGASSSLSAIGKDDDYYCFDGGRNILCIH